MLINEHHDSFSLLHSQKPIETNDTLLVFHNNNVLLRAAEDGSRLPYFKEVEHVITSIMTRHAFSQDGRHYYIASANEDTLTAFPGLVWESVRIFRTLQPALDGALLNAARHLAMWYENNRFCGLCGGPTHPAAMERALVCDRCDHTIYPCVQPAVIVAVTDGDRLLLARNANSTWHHFSLIAGYVEIGETAEQAVHREVAEEVGLRVKNVRYVKSQPWGFSQSLMLGYTAELDGSAAIWLQESELSEARWFNRGEIPAHNSSVSIAFDLIERFRRGDPLQA